VDYTQPTKNAPPTRPISWRSSSKQRPRTPTRMPCWMTRSQAHTANSSPCRLSQRQKGRWPRIGSMGTHYTHSLVAAAWSNILPGRQPIPSSPRLRFSRSCRYGRTTIQRSLPKQNSPNTTRYASSKPSRLTKTPMRRTPYKKHRSSPCRRLRWIQTTQKSSE